MNQETIQTKTTGKFQMANVLIISFAHMLHDIFSSFLAPILPLLIAKFGITYTQAGLLTVAGRIPSLFNPVIGIIAEKVRMRYLLILAPLFTVVSMSLLGLAPNYIVLLALLLTMGASSALFHVPSPAMIKHIAGDRTGKGMSFYMLGGELARTLAPLTILGAVSLWGLEGTYRLIPFGFLASGILYLKFRNISIREDFSRPTRSSTIHHTFRRYIPFFLLLIGYHIFATMLKSALTTYLPTYLTAKGNGIWIAGISLSVLQLSGAAGTFVAGTISDKIGRKATLLISGIASPLLMWAFILFDGIFMFPILLLLGFFTIATGPVILALVQDSDSEYPSFMNSIYMTISFVIGSIMALVIGIIGDHVGLELTYKICATAGFGTIPFILLLKDRKKR